MNKEFIFTDWFWMVLALGLMILEVLLGTSFFLLWLGISALIIAGIVWIFPGLLPSYQILGFAVVAGMSMIGWRFYLKKYPTKTDRPTLNRRAEQYIGRTFILVEPIVNGCGKIRVDDSTWRVEGEDLPAGTSVQVTEVNGIILKVKPMPL